MLVEYIRYTLPAEQTEAFEGAYARAQAGLRVSPHCLSWELSRCIDPPSRSSGAEETQHYILRIEWDSHDGHLQGFRKSAEFATFLAEIRPYIECVEEMRHYAVTEVASGGSIYADVGGTGTFFRLAHEMHERMCSDDLLGAKFSRAAETHVPHLAMWLIEVFGGPRIYSETLGDIGAMLRRHADQAITEDERARFVAIAKAAIAAHVKHPNAALAIARYFEWGSKIAVENSRPGHAPDLSAPVPTWGWE